MSLPRASLPATPGKLPLKPDGQPDAKYGTGVTWAWADRPLRQSTARATAKPNRPETMGIRATAMCPETIRSPCRECQWSEDTPVVGSAVTVCDIHAEEADREPGGRPLHRSGTRVHAADAGKRRGASAMK